MGAKQRMPITPLETNYMQQQEIANRRSAKNKKLLLRRLSVFLILALTFSYFCISTLVSKGEILEVKREEQIKLEETLVQLEKEQKVLENEIVKLNDDEYIAKLARSEYFLSDEGEIIFNIPESEKK